jgi:hypothetical protein
MNAGNVPQPPPIFNTKNIIVANIDIFLSLNINQIDCTKAVNINPAKAINNISYRKATPNAKNPNRPTDIDKTIV